MKVYLRTILLLLLFLGSDRGELRAEIVIYPVPQGIYYAQHNDDYTVRVRQAGDTEWTDV